jgi:hypothetical protein
MAHPVKRLALSKKTGRSYIQRAYGLKMCVAPDFSVLWSRDINAPINMQVFFVLLAAAALRAILTRS